MDKYSQNKSDIFSIFLKVSQLSFSSLKKNVQVSLTCVKQRTQSQSNTL